MRRIAVINQKGGVGKTTTTTNVGAALARAGKRVLMVDLDPQAHLTLHFGIDPGSDQAGTYELLTNNAPIDEARQQVDENLWVVGSSIDLAAAEVELVSIVGREVILRDLIDQHVVRDNGEQQDKYDYILMDCPPSLSVLTLNGLCAAEEVFIPLQPHYLALQGLSKLLETVSLVGKRINPQLRVGGVIVCMHESGTRLAAEVVEDVKTFLDHSRDNNVPWSQAKVYDAIIRRNIKLAEAPSHGCSIFDYAPDSNGACDYRLLAMEIDEPEAYAAEIARTRAETSTPSPSNTGADGPTDAAAEASPENTAPVESAAAEPDTDTAIESAPAPAPAPQTAQSPPESSEPVETAASQAEENAEPIVLHPPEPKSDSPAGVESAQADPPHTEAPEIKPVEPAAQPASATDEPHPQPADAIQSAPPASEPDTVPPPDTRDSAPPAHELAVNPPIKPSAVVRFGGTPLPPGLTTPAHYCTSGLDQRASLPVLAEPRPFAPIVGPIRPDNGAQSHWPAADHDPAV